VWPRSHDLLSNFGTLLIPLERLRIQTRNYVCTLIVTDTKRKNEKLAKQATEALRLGKIRESIAFDFQLTRLPNVDLVC